LGYAERLEKVSGDAGVLATSFRGPGISGMALSGDTNALAPLWGECSAHRDLSRYYALDHTKPNGRDVSGPAGGQKTVI